MKTLDLKRASSRRKSNILRDGNCTVGDLGKDTYPLGMFQIGRL